MAILSGESPLDEAVAAEDVLGSVMRLNLVAVDGAAIYMPEDTNFAEVVAINTGYIIHPEEVVADNFALLCLRRAGLGEEMPKPEFLDKLEAALNVSGE